VQRNLAQHFADSAIGVPFKHSDYRFSLPVILSSLGHLQDVRQWRDGVPHALKNRFEHAVLTGSPYPNLLLTLALERARTEPRSKTNDRRLYARAAIMRAVLNRQRRCDLQNGYTTTLTNYSEVPMDLDKSHPRSEYQFGRLLSQVDSGQYMSYGETNTTVADRYSTMCKTNPVFAFAQLTDMHQKYQHKLRRSDKRGIANNIDKEVLDIISKINLDDLSAPMSGEQAALFEIGYALQRKHNFEGARRRKAAKAAERDENDEEETDD
jgi:hypothetical protein